MSWAAVDGVLARCLGEPATAAEWEAAVERLESHGLAPLAQARLPELGVDPPAAARRELTGIDLMARARAARQRRALVEVLHVFAAVGIAPVLLKGAALAHLVYAEPALRPMGDLDLLVRRAEREAAGVALRGLGFEARPCPGRRGDKHVPYVRDEPGRPIVVELHDNLFLPGHPSAGLLDSFLAEPIDFAIDGVAARTLRPEAMLRHLCSHLVGHADVFTPLRLIWTLDVLLCAERYAGQIDWERLEREAALVPAVLSLLREPAPSPARLDFDGWPRQALAAQRQRGKSYRRIARDTLLPPSWWLRLRHGVPAGRSVAWHRWVRHPWQIGGMLARHLGDRLAEARAG